MKKLLHLCLTLSLLVSPLAMARSHYYDSCDDNAAQTLIARAFKISQLHLAYRYGSDNPRNGGMDCSGTMHYLLSTQGINAPRQSNEFYQWAWQSGKFYAVNSSSFSSFEFSRLKPGDLLFWTGTYKIHRDPPITHVMLYLGVNKQNQPLMFGASTHHTYHGRALQGVGVFDFDIHDRRSGSRFIGYSCIPGLTC